MSPEEDIMISKQYLKELKEALEWCAKEIDWRRQDPQVIKPIIETIKSLIEDAEQYIKN